MSKNIFWVFSENDKSDLINLESLQSCHKYKKNLGLHSTKLHGLQQDYSFHSQGLS